MEENCSIKLFESDLESMLSQVLAKARSRDEKLKAAKEKAASLTEEECKLLIKYLLAENNVVLEEYRICYMRGLMDGMKIKKIVE